MTKARVLVVDDMALYRMVIGRAIAAAEGLEMVGQVGDGQTALQSIRQLQPDLVTLDVEMPGSTGLDVLRELADWPAAQRPRVVVFSSQSVEGAKETLEALRLGAADFVLKPVAARGSVAIEEDLIPCLQRLAGQISATMPAIGRSSTPPPRPAVTGTRAVASTVPGSLRPNAGRRRLLVIASSTGGPPALEIALGSLPADFGAPILVVQHMPALFTRTMSEMLDKRCAIGVAEASDGVPLRPGQALVAPGDYHLLLVVNAGRPVVRLDQGERIFGLRPAADRLLRGLAEGASGLTPAELVVAVFTGMGSDGQAGIQALNATGRGCHVLTQTADSCVVYGMPRAVDEAGLSHAHFVPADFGRCLRSFTWAW